MIKIDKRYGTFIIKGDELTIAGELSYVMMEFYNKYGEKNFNKCVEAFKTFIEEKKSKTTYHIELANGNKKPIIIEDKNLKNAINKINNLNIPEQVKKYAIEILKKESNK